MLVRLGQVRLVRFGQEASIKHPSYGSYDLSRNIHCKRFSTNLTNTKYHVIKYHQYLLSFQLQEDIVLGEYKEIIILFHLFKQMYYEQTYVYMPIYVYVEVVVLAMVTNDGIYI